MNDNLFSNPSNIQQWLYNWYLCLVPDVMAIIMLPCHMIKIWPLDSLSTQIQGYLNSCHLHIFPRLCPFWPLCTVALLGGEVTEVVLGLAATHP